MTGGPMLQLWNEWATQILILLSFALQIFLFVFAWTRRHGSSNVLRILIWLAYLMADSTAVYTLGHLSINGSPRGQNLAVFWAPFLLVHLGSQDTIIAYALEDNQLWARHLLNLGVQAFGVAYVLYKHIAEIPTLLGLATGLMFLIGVIKYGERIWALKCATLQSILSSIRTRRLLPGCYGALPSRGARAGERDEEDLLLFAQAILPFCKGAMSNFHVSLFSTMFMSTSTGDKLIPSGYMWNWNWKAMCKVVEMELSLMYDILYTKAAVIHTWYGYLFRLLSPLATISAFLLFQLSGNKDGYSRIDVTITYILLVGAFLLDMASMFSALGSTWTCNYLWTRDFRRFGLIVMSLRRRVKAARGNRGWSGSIGQFSLLHLCSRDSTKLSVRVAKMMGLEDWWNKIHYSQTLVISEDVKEMVLKRVWQALKEIHDPKTKDEIQSTPYEKDMEEPVAMMPQRNDYIFGPEYFEDTAMRRGKLVKALDFSDDLQHVILEWHVATDVFLLCSTPNDSAASSTCVKAIKALSDYMLFLVAICPDMVPGIEISSLYDEMCNAVGDMWRREGESSFDPSSGSREKKLASILQNSPEWPLQQSGSAVLMGVLHARVLLELVDKDNPDKSGAISDCQNRDDIFMDSLNRLMPDLESSCRGAVCLYLIFPKPWLSSWMRGCVFSSSRLLEAPEKPMPDKSAVGVSSRPSSGSW